jgi:hypothetical protein
MTMSHWVFGFRRFDTAPSPHVEGYVELNHCRSNVELKLMRYFTVFYVGFL